MKTRNKLPVAYQRRRDERGAALMMMLLIAMLLLAAGGALILSTAMSNSLAYDSSGEEQAYYAAEAGIEDSLSALRGQYAPNPLIQTIPVSGIIPDADKLTFRGAVTRATSNDPADPTTSADGSAFPYRLSRWLGYDYQSAGASYSDRKIVAAPYSLLSGSAYSVTVADPDNSQNVTFSTTGTINGSTNPFTQNGTNPGDTATISFTPTGSTALVAYPAVNSALGSFNVRYTNLGALIPSTPFVLQINQTTPYPGQFTINGTIQGLVAPLGSTLAVTFGTMTAVVQGTAYTLTGSNPTLLLTTTATGTITSIPVRVTAPDPRQLIIRSTGYGPKGARKQLEAVVDNFAFLINPPATICIRGSDNQTASMTFDLGSSNAKNYSGIDASGVQPQQPTVAISLHDWGAANGGIVKGSTVDDPKLSILDLTNPPSMNMNTNTIPSPWPGSLTPVPDNDPATPAPDVPKAVTTPDFLRTADAAREMLYGPTGSNGGLMGVAQARNAYYTSFSGTAGDYNNGGFTFVDGDCNLDGGGGLLVVTGTLTLNGNSQFRGVILVMGGGNVVRQGGGNARIRGSWVIASFDRNSGNFTAPSFDVSGGGNADFEYDWQAIVGANRGIGLSISGLAER